MEVEVAVSEAVWLRVGDAPVEAGVELGMEEPEVAPVGDSVLSTMLVLKADVGKLSGFTSHTRWYSENQASLLYMASVNSVSLVML